MNTPDIRRPSYIGSPPLHPLVMLVLFTSFLLACVISTQYAAFHLGYNPSLGKSVINHVYAPWDILVWAAHFLNPISREIYPYSVYAAIDDSLKLLAELSGVAIFVTFVAALIGRALYNPTSQLFDSTKWSSAEEAKALGFFTPAGPIVGGLKIPLGKIIPVRYAGDKNIIMIEPPGGGKSSVLKTNLLMPLRHSEAHYWSEVQRRLHPWGEEPNIFVPDVKGELFAQTSGYQRDVLKKDVFLLAPLGNIEDQNGEPYDSEAYATYNPFWSIRIGTSLGYQDCLAKAQNIIDGEGEGIKTHWDRTSLGFGAAVIEKLGFLALNRGRWDQFSLPGLAEFVSSMTSKAPAANENDKAKESEAALNKLIHFLKNTPDDPTGVFGWHRYDFEKNVTVPTDVKPSIFAAAVAMERKESRERASVYSSFIAHLSLYLGEQFKKYATTSSFSWRNIAKNSTRASTIYLGINPLDIPKVRPFLRLVLADALEELTRGGNANIDGRSGRKSFRPFWFALDEIAAFRRLSEIEVGSGFFRGYGVYLFMIFQSLAQIANNYGQNEVLSETTGMMLFGRPARVKAAEEISEELGFESVVVNRRSRSASNGTAQGSVSMQDSPEVHRIPLLTPKQVMQIGDDKLIAITSGRNFYLTKFPFFKNQKLLERARRKPAKNAHYKPLDEPTFVREARLELGEKKWLTLSMYIRDQSVPSPVTP